MPLIASRYKDTVRALQKCLLDIKSACARLNLQKIDALTRNFDQITKQITSLNTPGDTQPTPPKEIYSSLRQLRFNYYGPFQQISDTLTIQLIGTLNIATTLLNDHCALLNISARFPLFPTLEEIEAKQAKKIGMAFFKPVAPQKPSEPLRFEITPLRSLTSST